MNSFKIGNIEYKTKKDAIFTYRRLLHSASLLSEFECKQVISLARAVGDFRDKIYCSIVGVYAHDGLWLILSDGCKLRVPVYSLVNAVYRLYNPTKDELRVKGLRHFKKACKLVVRGVKIDVIKKFIEIEKLTPCEVAYTYGERGIHLFLDKSLRVKFKEFARNYEEFNRKNTEIVKGYHSFYMACRYTVHKCKPFELGKEAHHANEGGFVQIVKDFIEYKQIDPTKIDYARLGSHSIKFVDLQLRAEFKEFHNSRVMWEMLTPSEHAKIHSV